jgi:hypothetical protein
VIQTEKARNHRFLPSGILVISTRLVASVETSFLVKKQFLLSPALSLL